MKILYLRFDFDFSVSLDLEIIIWSTKKFVPHWYLNPGLLSLGRYQSSYEPLTARDITFSLKFKKLHLN